MNHTISQNDHNTNKTLLFFFMANVYSYRHLLRLDIKLSTAPLTPSLDTFGELTRQRLMKKVKKLEVIVARR